MTMERYDSVGTFTFSALPPDDLEADSYTLVTLAIDCSGSIRPWKYKMEETVKEIIKCCKDNAATPRADNLLIRTIIFGPGNTTEEVHGFLSTDKLTLDTYSGMLSELGCTPLHEAVVDACAATATHAQTLFDQDYPCNGILVLITDGTHYNPSGMVSIHDAKMAQSSVLSHQTMESWRSILIGVGTDPSTDRALENFKNELKFDEFQTLDDTTIASFGKLAQFVSQSVSAQANAQGTGAPSQPITF